MGTILDVTEIPEEREADIDDRFVRTYKRVWRVLASDLSVGQLQARLATGIPRPYTPYTDPSGLAFDLGAVVRKVTCRPQEGAYAVWLVTAEYSSERQSGESSKIAQDRLDGKPIPGGYDSGADHPSVEDPRNRPAEITWRFSRQKKVIQTDQDGRAVVNSAGDAFDPPPEVDDHRIELEITRNQATFNQQTAYDFVDSTNDDTFFGATAGKVKVESITSSLEWEHGIPFWRTSYVFHFRNEGWDIRPLDEGFHTVTGAVRFLAKDNDGNPVSTPILLDGKGKASTRIAMTGATNATPIVVTAAGHGFVTGDTVSIAETLGNLAANGSWTVTVIDANTFSLNNSTGSGAYTGGTGSVMKVVYLRFRPYVKKHFADLNLP